MTGTKKVLTDSEKMVIGPRKRHRADFIQIDAENKQVLKQVKAGKTTMKELVESTGMDRQKLGRRLAFLVSDGKLRMVYQGRGTRYELA